MGYKIGIDFGTTNSAVAYVSGSGHPEIIPNMEGERVTPSVVSFDEQGVYVGRLAKQRALLNPTQTVRSIKRHMAEEEYQIRVGDTTYLPQEVAALILTQLRNNSEVYLGDSIEEAVITVPAYFNTNQKMATKEAGEIAGINVYRIFDEPTAAAMAYGLDRTGSEIIVVYDLGGGTFDVSMLRFRNGKFSVLANSGDNALGGDDFDKTIVDFLIDEFKQKTGFDLRNGPDGSVEPGVMQRLYEAGEDAKKHLSSLTETQVTVPFLIPEKGLSLDVRLTRNEFERISQDLLLRTQKPLREAMEGAKLSPRDVDVVLCAGGSTRMPMVRDFVADLMGKEALLSINPDECVALGAAITAERGTRGVTFIASHSIGVETEGGVFTPLIPKGSTLPTMADEEFTTSYDGQSAVNFPIFEGEAEVAALNVLLGEIRMDDLQSGPSGEAGVRVRFELTTEGILIATAENIGNGKRTSVEIEGVGLNEQRKTVASHRVAELASRIRH